MSGLVGYASDSGDEDSDSEQEQQQQKQQEQEEQPKGAAGVSFSSLPASKAKASKTSKTSKAKKSELKEEKSSKKAKKAKKKKKKKKKAGQALPLLEAPVSVDSDSDASGLEDTGRAARKKSSSLLSVRNSVWDDDSADESAAAYSSLSAAPVGPQAPAPSAYVPPEAFAQGAAAFAGSLDGDGGLDELEDGDKGAAGGRRSDRDIERRLAAGESLDSALDGRETAHMSSDAILAHSKAIKRGRDEEREQEEALSTRTGGNVIDKRMVSGSMKRKHQLSALAYNAQEEEAGLQKMWANAKKAKAATSATYGF